MAEQEESEDGVIALSKKQKCASASEVIVSDRISSLPDSLLHHILSFLPTREVVVTSLLSKRWRSLWHSMPTFDFDGRGISRRHFIQFVDAVLLMADLKPIEMFLLKCPKFFVQKNGERTKYKTVSPDKINIWIRTAINRKVGHFELYSDFNEKIIVPSSIFNSSRIRVLKLQGVTVNIPSFVKLPSLKVMHLVEVKLKDYECLKHLLSGCALLEDLVLNLMVKVDDGEKEEDDFMVNVERLEHLVSANVPSFITLKALTNVTRLHLFADKLLEADIPMFNKLTDLEISRIEYDHLTWVMKCLQSCPKLEILKINQLYFEGDIDGKGPLVEQTHDVPQCLLSHLKEFTLGTYVGWKWEFEIARYIMENARVLRTLSINCAGMDVVKKYSNLNMLASCPRCSVHCRLLFDCNLQM